MTATGTCRTRSKVTLGTDSSTKINGGTTGLTISSATYNSSNITTTGVVTLPSGTAGTLTVSSGTLTLGGDLTAVSIEIVSSANFVSDGKSISLSAGITNAGTGSSIWWVNETLNSFFNQMCD